MFCFKKLLLKAAESGRAPLKLSSYFSGCERIDPGTFKSILLPISTRDNKLISLRAC